MLKIRKERELERRSYKLAKEISRVNNNGKIDKSRFRLVKLKKRILKRLMEVEIED